MAAWCVAELAERRGAAFAQVAGAELVGGGVRGVQEFPRAGVLAEPDGGSGRPPLGLRCLQRQVQAAEHFGCPAQLVCCCLRLVCQQGFAAGVGEGGDCFRLCAVLTNARRNALDEAIAPLLELAAPLRTGAQRDALAAYVIRKLHSAWNTRKPPGSRE